MQVFGLFYVRGFLTTASLGSDSVFRTEHFLDDFAWIFGEFSKKYFLFSAGNIGIALRSLVLNV
jgi:hypothetical protein